VSQPVLVQVRVVVPGSFCVDSDLALTVKIRLLTKNVSGEGVLRCSEDHKSKNCKKNLPSFDDPIDGQTYQVVTVCRKMMVVVCATMLACLN